MGIILPWWANSTTTVVSNKLIVDGDDAVDVAKYIEERTHWEIQYVSGGVGGNTVEMKRGV